ncbi:MAG: ribonuclease J [Alphaproteobacteria bacterium]|jgi:ribonuclease J|nr:ribonuclease J [Alphaproteobacteria bacterium]MDP6780191.1 ribonuclease J [Alphaproteobacteria bacterium]
MSRSELETDEVLLPEGTPVPGEELLFLPLGGSGEIGMNLNLYGSEGEWIIIDLGVTFGDDTMPWVDIITPDPAFIEDKRERLAGIVLTHAHEDHIGAVPYLWRRLRCPIYATSFTASILRRKLRETGLEKEAVITEIPLSGSFMAGPFTIDLITLTHSIPEPNAVVIRSAHGTVLHTGDWKLDPDPLVGEVTNEAALRELGEDGVLAMVCDSTNVFTEGASGSEGDLRKSLNELVGCYASGRVAVGCFASNIARLETLALVAADNGRHAALIGRSLWSFYDSAKENGYLTDIPEFLTEYDVGRLPREKVLLICTGSQGESRAAFARIASGNHPRVELEKGDVAIFSSRIIPGNEKSIARLQNRLVALGVEVVTEKDHFIHVSGHPGRDELTQMYQWVNPQVVVPVHGETRHLHEQAKLARSCQIPQAVEIENGLVLRLAPGDAEVVGRVHSGRLTLDGNRMVPLNSSMMTTRKRMMFNGSLAVSVVIGDDGELLSDPVISGPGHFATEGEEREEAFLARLRAAATVAVETLSRSSSRDDAEVAEAVRCAVRKAFFLERTQRPVTQVHVVRI